MSRALFLLALLCAGCDRNSVAGLITFTDSLNGCQYVKANGDKALTPRMGADGKQICGGAK